VYNRLTQAGTAFTAGYRPDDLRAWKQTTSTGVRTYYLYDGTTLLHEIGSNGNLLYSYGWGAAGLIERYPGSGINYYVYAFDPAGNAASDQNQCAKFCSGKPIM